MLGNTKPFWIGGSTKYPLNSGHFPYEYYQTGDNGEWKINRSKTGVWRKLSFLKSDNLLHPVVYLFGLQSLNYFTR